MIKGVCRSFHGNPHEAGCRQGLIQALGAICQARVSLCLHCLPDVGFLRGLSTADVNSLDPSTMCHIRASSYPLPATLQGTREHLPWWLLQKTEEASLSEGKWSSSLIGSDWVLIGSVTIPEPIAVSRVIG